jgi:lysophospholipase L1-like esterase
MSKASVARRIAASAAFGGGSVVGVGVGAYALLKFEVFLARRRVGVPVEKPFVVDGWYGRSGPLDAGAVASRSGVPLRMLMLGDSSAAGLGADVPADTPAVVIATGLAEAAGRPVELRSIAVVGAQTADLDGQLNGLGDTDPTWIPDVAVMLIGANDVTHTVLPAVSVRHLDQAVRRLRDLGAEVVVGTCPDLGTIRPIPHPLRHIGRRWSRTLAAAQTICVVEAGGRSVSLGDILGPEFHANPGEYFSEDRFHPSSVGYRRCAEVLLPSACAALGVGPQPGDAGALTTARHPSPGRVLPVAEAAVAAAEQPGTEVSGARVEGQDRSGEGRWAAVRRRLPLRRAPSPETGPVANPGSPDIETSAEPADVG